MNKNTSQPITNRANNNIINQKKDSFPNNRNNKKILDEINIQSPIPNPQINNRFQSIKIKIKFLFNLLNKYFMF